MGSHEFLPTRRSVLGAMMGGGAAVALAGCTRPPAGGGGGPVQPWEVTRFAADLSVAGYVDRPSLPRGEQVVLHLDCTGTDAGGPVRVEVFRTGWHDGVGALAVLPATVVTAPAEQAPTGVVDPVSLRCEAAWEPALVVTTGDDQGPWPSGVYVIRLTAASGKQAYVPFTLRDDASTASVLFVSNHMTWWAYNTAGGHDLYNDGAEVSPTRPFRTDSVRSSQGAGEYFWLEYRVVRWLERNGFDVTYVADFDLDRRPVPDATRVILLAGHSEYWTGPMRDNVDRALAERGVGLVSLGANTCYWRGRLEGGTDTTPGRYVCWKTENGAPHPADPLADDPELATQLFRRIPGQAEQVLLGGGFHGWVDANAYSPGPSLNSTALRIADVSHPVFDGTGIGAGEAFPGLCGGEFDWRDPALGGTVPTIVCSTPLDVVFSSYHQIGSYVYQQSAIQERSYPGGVTARVFNAGTYTWAWGLDDFSFEDYRFTFANPRIQALTSNIVHWAAKEL